MKRRAPAPPADITTSKPSYRTYRCAFCGRVATDPQVLHTADGVICSCGGAMLEVPVTAQGTLGI